MSKLATLIIQAVIVLALVFSANSLAVFEYSEPAELELSFNCESDGFSDSEDDPTFGIEFFDQVNFSLLYFSSTDFLLVSSSDFPATLGHLRAPPILISS